MTGLFTPLKIKSCRLSNRIVVPPMGTGLATELGEVTDDHITLYGHFAKETCASSGHPTFSPP